MGPSPTPPPSPGHRGEVDTAEDYTHWSGWTLVTAGVFLVSGTVTANAVLVGDQFTIPIGDLDLSLSVAA